MASMLPKFRASSADASAPTRSIPSATITLASGRVLLRSTAASRLDTLLSAMRSIAASSPRLSFSAYMSATSVISPASIIACPCFTPSPSMSIAPRLTKCSTRRTSCAGQDAFSQ